MSGIHAAELMKKTDQALDTKEVGSPHPAVEELNNRLFFRLFRATNTLHTKGTKALISKSVTTQQWSVLGALSRPQAKDGMSVGELSRYLLVSRQNLTGILDRLEREEVIERVPGKGDRRTRNIKLTSKGEKLWPALGPLIFGFYDSALEGFTLEERQQFTVFINKLQKNMSAL